MPNTVNLTLTCDEAELLMTLLALGAHLLSKKDSDPVGLDALHDRIFEIVKATLVPQPVT